MEKDVVTTKTLKIKESFRTIIPPLTPEEYSLLERSILEDGCRDAIITWKGFIIDGHNRYGICEKHGLHYDTEEIVLDTEQDALVWIINNQLGRRNITDYQKGELVLKKKDILLKKGKKQQGRRTDLLSIVDRKLQSHSTREEMAKDIGVSSGTMARIEVIVKEAPEEVKEQLRHGAVKIGTAYKKLKEDATSQPEAKETLQKPGAIACAEMAIAHLKKIRHDDPSVDQALNSVLEWMLKNNPLWAKRAVNKSREIMHKYPHTRTKPDGKTSDTKKKQESHKNSLKENLRGVQESLWEK